MKLEIEWIRGKKHSKYDRIYLITTKEKEPISIFKLGLLTNQLALNEVNIKPWLDLNSEILFFEAFLTAAITDAKNKINWAEPINEKRVMELCKSMHLPPEKVDFDLLRRTQQRFLEEFQS